MRPPDLGVDVVSRLRRLPHHSEHSLSWLGNENHYEWYGRLLRALDVTLGVTSVCEVGTFYGYFLATAAMVLDGKDPPPQFFWVDDESYAPGTNELALENVWDVFRERFAEDTSQPPAEAFLRHARRLPPPGGVAADLVHVDGDHSYEGCRRDLEWALEVEPRVIIGHDYLLEPGVKRAVDGVMAEHKVYDCFLLPEFKHGLYVVAAQGDPKEVLWALSNAAVGPIQRVW